MVSTQVNEEEFCRTCLAKEIDLISIYEVYIENITIENIITTLTGVKIESGDGLPTVLCYMCRKKATKAYDFRQQTIEADRNLRKKKKINPRDNNQFENPVKSEQAVSNGEDDDLDIEFLLDYNNDPDSPESIKVETKELHIKHKKTDKKFVPDPKDGGTYCPLCATSFGNADGLTSHMWEHHADIMGPKKRGRPKRLGTTAILNKLSENGVHVKWVTDMKFECNFCSEHCKSKDDLDKHVLDSHTDMKLVSCLLCKKVYSKQEDFKKHNCAYDKKDDKTDANEAVNESENVNKNPLSGEVLLQSVISQVPDTECVSDICVCEYCGCVCAGLEHLARHKDDEHPDLSPRCHLCYKVFASLKSAARHRSSCKQRERTLTCTTCGARFAHEVSLNKHILRTHRGQTVTVRFTPDRNSSYRCDICSTKFCRKDLLARHVKVHKLSDKVFECDTCSKVFHRRSNLRTHMRVHENGGNGSSSSCLCLYCGRGFSNSSNLIVHMRRHTGEKPYKCDFCGKGFPRSSDLQCHRRSHTGEKPCVCGICGKGFSRSNKLSRHMRVHTGAKPYKCVYCEKAFSQSNDLTLHVRRHTGDKPYVCELCGDRFIQGTALQNHRRAHGHYTEAPPVPTAPPPYQQQPQHSLLQQRHTVL
ncbi:unnamed protein product [Leptosia nina]|uniref:Uncharacterized protein n=1 Tax=Leptosia nina TaxID=320188 RepID=A0AAV1JZD0_9NEOP